MNRKDNMEVNRTFALRACMLPGLALIAALSGCIQVEAPDKPIVIELNMNIRQEVVYRIDEQVETLIDQREDIF